MQANRINHFISAVFLFCIFISWKIGDEKHSPTIIYYSLKSLNSSAVLSNKNVFPRATTQNQSRIRTAQTKWTKHGYMCLWLPDAALYHNIEPNPGPTAKPKCSSCDKTVRKNQAAILCKGCNGNYHGKCGGLRRDDIEKLRNFQADWTCLTCSLPQFSDSFFDSFNSKYRFNSAYCVLR